MFKRNFNVYRAPNMATGNFPVPTETSSVTWKDASFGKIPHNAVVGGTTPRGETVYIGRARIKENMNELTPGVVLPSEKCLSISYGTGVRKSEVYEVLIVDNLKHIHWLSHKMGEVPKRAVIGGIDCSYLEPLYIGRTTGDLSNGRTWRGQRFPFSDAFSLSEVTMPGKVHPSHKCLYIPYDEKEYIFRDYEVLTLTATPSKLKAFCKYTILHYLQQNAEDKTKQEVNDDISKLPLPDIMKEYLVEEDGEPVE